MNKNVLIDTLIVFISASIVVVAILMLCDYDSYQLSVRNNMPHHCMMGMH